MLTQNMWYIDAEMVISNCVYSILCFFITDDHIRVRVFTTDDHFRIAYALLGIHTDHDANCCGILYFSTLDELCLLHTKIKEFPDE